MADNFDDFDDAPNLDDGMVVDAMPEDEAPEKRASISETLKTNPAFKIFLILIGVGALVSAGLGAFSSPKTSADTPSVIGGSSELTSTPGGQASPAFQQAVVEASKQRVQAAAQTGGSAIPTPLGGQTQITTLEPSDTTKNEDPLSEFRVEAKQPSGVVMPEPPAPATAPLPTASTYNGYAAPNQPNPDLQSLSSAMQSQMTTLMNNWTPTTAKVITITPPTAVTDATTAAAQNAAAQQAAAAADKVALVQAGTINYGQMMMEANSDIPGPVMAMIASGPFSGGKAIGSFETTDDHLVIHFTLVNYKNKDYPVDILAIDPDTTLGGMATDIDQRYWSRVVLPAAADFLTGFANSFAEADQSVAVQDGVVVSSRAGSSLRRGFGEGFAKTGQQLSDILEQQGNNTKPLVRVRAGTPVGLFFVSSVYDPTTNPQQPNGYTGAYGVNGLSGINGVNPYGRYGQQGVGVPITQMGGQYPAGYGVNGQNYALPGYNSGSNAVGNGYNNTGLQGSGIQVIPSGGYGQPTYINR